MTFGGQITDEVRRGSLGPQVPARAAHAGHMAESTTGTTGPVLTAATAASLFLLLEGAGTLWGIGNGEVGHGSVKYWCLYLAAGRLGASVSPLEAEKLRLLTCTPVPPPARNIQGAPASQITKPDGFLSFPGRERPRGFETPVSLR